MADEEPPRKRGKYKTWLLDPGVTIPRTTRWRLGVKQPATLLNEGEINSSFYDSQNEADNDENHIIYSDSDSEHGESLDITDLEEMSDIEELISRHGNSSGESDSELEDTDEVEDEEIGEETDNVPLYENASVSKLAAHAIVHLFVMEHKLSNQALNDLIRMLSILLPEGHKFARSGYLLKKYFVNLFQEPLPKKHKYCGTCLDFIPPSNNLCSNKVCQELNGSIKEFLEIDLRNQLSRLYKGNSDQGHYMSF